MRVLNFLLCADAHAWYYCNRVYIYILAGYSLGSIGPNQNNDRRQMMILIMSSEG